MELRRYLDLIRRRVALIIVAVIVGGVAGFISTSRTPVYTASATIYVGSEGFSGADAAQLELETGLNEVVATFAQMIPSPVIAQKALDKVHLDRSAGVVAASTSATVVTGTNLITVQVSDANAEDAVRLTNGVANAFVSQIGAYQSSATSSKTSSSQGAVPNEPAYVFADASYAARSSSGTVKNIALGAVFGLVISILLVFLLDYLDVTIKSPEELERRVGLPVLGIVPRFETLSLSSHRAPPRRGADG
jgi:capsular polysaccharide biosynthesis protein